MVYPPYRVRTVLWSRIKLHGWWWYILESTARIKLLVDIVFTAAAWHLDCPYSPSTPHPHLKSASCLPLCFAYVQLSADHLCHQVSGAWLYIWLYISGACPIHTSIYIYLMFTHVWLGPVLKYSCLFAVLFPRSMIRESSVHFCLLRWWAAHGWILIYRSCWSAWWVRVRLFCHVVENCEV